MNINPEAWQRLAAHIRADRARAGWTQAELADHAGVSTKSVYTLESGSAPSRRPPTLYRITHALGWPQDFADSILSGPALEHADESGEVVQLFAKSTPNEAVSSLRGAIEFSHACAQMGADPNVVRRFDEAADALLESAMSARAARQARLTQDDFAAVAHSPERDGGTGASVDRSLLNEAVRRFENETEETSDTPET